MNHLPFYFVPVQKWGVRGSPQNANLPGKPYCVAVCLNLPSHGVYLS